MVLRNDLARLLVDQIRYDILCIAGLEHATGDAADASDPTVKHQEAGRRQAVRQLALTGDPVDADRALALGLVDEVVPTGDALARATAIAPRMAEGAPVSVQLVKQMVNVAEGEATLDVLEQMASAIAAFTDDAAEGAASFREKRAARYEGR